MLQIAVTKRALRAAAEAATFMAPLPTTQVTSTFTPATFIVISAGTADLSRQAYMTSGPIAIVAQHFWEKIPLPQTSEQLYLVSPAVPWTIA